MTHDEPPLRRTARISPAFLLFFVAACSSGPPARTSEPTLSLAPVALPPDLERVLRDYERAWQARDADGLATLFSPNGFVLSNHRPPVRGREAIRSAYAGAGGPLYLRPVSFATEGSVGFIVGSYGHDPSSAETGKFVLALERQVGGPWLIAADIENGSSPPRPAPAQREGTP